MPLLENHAAAAMEEKFGQVLQWVLTGHRLNSDVGIQGDLKWEKLIEDMLHSRPTVAVILSKTN
jgi:hypothetical protein